MLTGRGPRPPMGLHVLLLMAGVMGLAAAQSGSLTCVEKPSSGVFQRCSDTGTLAVGQNKTYMYSVSQASASEQTFDLNITLTSLTGDADL